MKEYFARLSSLERRFVVGVMLLIFILLNAVFIWPRFSDWSQTKFQLTKPRNRLGNYKTAIAEMPKYEKQVKTMESEGLAVPPEDQAIDFLRTIQSEAARSGVNIINTTRLQARTNDLFFVEQAQSMSVQSGEQQLVDFLYNLGSGNSLTRVRALSLRRETAGHQLAANITLVASYQKKPPVRAAPAANKSATSTAKNP